MIAALFFVLGVLAFVVVLGVLRDGKRREAAWEEFWGRDVDGVDRAKKKGGRP